MSPDNKAILWICLVFLAGICFGGSLAYLVIKQNQEVGSLAPLLGPSPGHGSRFSDFRPPSMLMESLNKELNLDKEQAEQVSTILEQNRDLYQKTYKSYREEFSALRKKTRNQIREVLREDQFAAFDEFMKRRHPKGSSHNDRPPPK